MDKQAFSRRVYDVRKEQGLKSGEYATGIKKNPAYIRQIEITERLPSLDAFVDMCNLTGASPNYYLQDSLEPPADDSDFEEAWRLFRSLTPGQKKFALAMLTQIQETFA